MPRITPRLTNQSVANGGLVPKVTRRELLPTNNTTIQNTPKIQIPPQTQAAVGQFLTTNGDETLWAPLNTNTKTTLTGYIIGDGEKLGVAEQLPDNLLTNNVPLKNQANTFTANQTINGTNQLVLGSANDTGITRYDTGIIKITDGSTGYGSLIATGISNSNTDLHVGTSKTDGILEIGTFGSGTYTRTDFYASNARAGRIWSDGTWYFCPGTLVNRLIIGTNGSEFYSGATTEIPSSSKQKPHKPQTTSKFKTQQEQHYSPTQHSDSKPHKPLSNTPGQPPGPEPESDSTRPSKLSKSSDTDKPAAEQSPAYPTPQQKLQQTKITTAKEHNDTTDSPPTTHDPSPDSPSAKSTDKNADSGT